ncbi:DNA N-6-adenine-methyltransferase [Leptolyngbya sp. FACHB-8]|uniref:DNA N-6-adenine-methyltransferase n=1 Tax=unclassified Leptolyngbya TaxID=2650499 RepID=UPI001686D53D|nr:DNA N-6-adenine-methyltransferase [Leptolyngbya sp. FACHB-8]MBD1908972.1 hypothetical protein [Leptolyngbya sp. FACHB-8]
MQQRGKEIHRLQKRIVALIKKADAIASTAKRLGLQLPNIQHSSDSNEWYTLAEWVERARRVMGGIDLDPASNPEAQGWIQAATYYTQEQDGMVQPWKGRMWLNPPYGQRKSKPVKVYGASAWIERAIAEYKAGNVHQAVLWLRASGNSGIQALEAKRFPRVVLGRVNHAPAGANGKPQKGVGHDTVVYYLGPNSDAFHHEFMNLAVTGNDGDRQQFV